MQTYHAEYENNCEEILGEKNMLWQTALLHKGHEFDFKSHFPANKIIFEITILWKFEVWNLILPLTLCKKLVKFNEGRWRNLNNIDFWAIFDPLIPLLGQLEFSSFNFLYLLPINFIQKIIENRWTIPAIDSLRKKFWPFDPSYANQHVKRLFDLDTLAFGTSVPTTTQFWHFCKICVKNR